MNITKDTSLDELLELWVKYSRNLIETGNYGENGFKNIELINQILNESGVSSKSIVQIEKSSYTISYSHRGGLVTRDIPIT